MDQYLAEIRVFPYTFAPKGWAFCHGQLMPISQNTALFSILGTMYGGDGKSTFALPDLSGRAPLAYGETPGLTERVVGEVGGSETVTLLQSEIPIHTHLMRGTTTIGEVSSPTGTTPLSRSTGKAAYHAADGNLVAMAPQVVAPTGGGTPHNNLMPYLCFHFCIALQGEWPTRP